MEMKGYIVKNDAFETIGFQIEYGKQITKSEYNDLLLLELIQLDAKLSVLKDAWFIFYDALEENNLADENRSYKFSATDRRINDIENRIKKIFNALN